MSDPRRGYSILSGIDVTKATSGFEIISSDGETYRDDDDDGVSVVWEDSEEELFDECSKLAGVPASYRSSGRAVWAVRRLLIAGLMFLVLAMAGVLYWFWPTWVEYYEEWAHPAQAAQNGTAYIDIADIEDILAQHEQGILAQHEQGIPLEELDLLESIAEQGLPVEQLRSMAEVADTVQQGYIPGAVHAGLVDAGLSSTLDDVSQWTSDEEQIQDYHVDQTNHSAWTYVYN